MDGASSVTNTSLGFEVKSTLESFCSASRAPTKLCGHQSEALIIPGLADSNWFTFYDIASGSRAYPPQMEANAWCCIKNYATNTLYVYDGLRWYACTTTVEITASSPLQCIQHGDLEFFITRTRSEINLKRYTESMMTINEFWQGSCQIAAVLPSNFYR